MLAVYQESGITGRSTKLSGFLWSCNHNISLIKYNLSHRRQIYIQITKQPHVLLASLLTWRTFGSETPSLRSGTTTTRIYPFR